MANQAWQTFLSTQPINAQPSASNTLMDLSHHGLIAVSGDDAVTFLQGQVTNDVKQLAQGAHYAGYCTPKGRMLALFYAHQVAQTLYLQCPTELIPAIIKRLRMYVMRSKVVIEDASETLVSFGIHGISAKLALTVYFNVRFQNAELPTQAHQVSHAQDITVIQLPANNHNQRFQIIAPLAQAQTLWQALSAQCNIANANAWERIEIANGLPNVYASTQEQFVPQMLNLDLLNGINFKKGCYTGQEIVARTHYLGTVKRRSFIAHIASTQAPQVGEPVLDAQQADCGQLVRVAKTEHGYDVLVESRLEAKEAGDITWQGNVLQWVEMPYALQ